MAKKPAEAISPEMQEQIDAEVSKQVAEKIRNFNPASVKDEPIAGNINQLIETGKISTMKHLNAQPKVPMMLERKVGEPLIETVNINGCVFEIKRGETTEVPYDVAMVLYNKFSIENKVAQMSAESVKKLSQQ
jgi:hypothetical protein